MSDNKYFIPFKDDLTEDELNYFIKELAKQKSKQKNMFFVEFPKAFSDSIEYNFSSFSAAVNFSIVACKIVYIEMCGCYVTLCDNDYGKMLKNCLEDGFENVYLRRITATNKIKLDNYETVNYKLFKFYIETHKKEETYPGGIR